MDIIKIICSVIVYLVFVYLGIYSLYLFVFSLAGKIFPVSAPSVSKQLTRFVIYICSYKEDDIILNSATQAVTIDYPADMFHICVIADSLKPQTIEKLKQLPIQVLEVVFESSTKSKALHKAIENTAEGYDAAVVFDIDNIASPDFLYRLNDHLQAGAKVVQGHRMAKNTETSIALLDAISEEINNHLFRKSQQVFHLSAAIIGSGMALEYQLFKETMMRIDAVGGFDKEMGLLLTQNCIHVDYAENAIIFDEKVSNPEVFKKQRKRWLSAQFSLFKKYGKTGLRELFVNRNFDYFNEIYQLSVLPRVLMLGLMPVMLLFSVIFQGIGPAWIWWLVATLACYTGILLAIPARFVDRKFWGAVVRVPLIFVTMVLLLFKLKGANKKFIHTPHIHNAK